MCPLCWPGSREEGAGAEWAIKREKMLQWASVSLVDITHCCSALGQGDPGVMDASDPALRTLFGADKHSSISQKQIRFTSKHCSLKFAPNMGSGAWNGGRVLAEQKGWEILKLNIRDTDSAWLALSKESIGRDCLWGLSLKARCSQRKWVSWLLGGYASFYPPLTSPCCLLLSLESSFCKNTPVKMCPAVPQATLWNAVEPYRTSLVLCRCRKIWLKRRSESWSTMLRSPMGKMRKMWVLCKPRGQGQPHTWAQLLMAQGWDITIVLACFGSQSLALHALPASFSSPHLCVNSCSLEALENFFFLFLPISSHSSS